MKNIFFNILLFLISIGLFFYSLNYNIPYILIGIFLSGSFFGIFLMKFKLNINNDKLSSFKKELEKETISGQESASRIKILENKIEVLEKALENALKNKS